MKRTQLLQELRKMRFEQAWEGWSEGRLSQFGMLLHQDGSTHAWVPGCQWDLIVTFEELKLQIPQDRVRMHDVKVKVRVQRYPDGDLAVLHGPRLLARFGADGQPLIQEMKKAA